MRNFLDILDRIITESRGIGARVRGAEFVSTTNPDEKIYVDQVLFFPETGGEYETEQEMNAALQAFMEQFEGYVDLIKEFSKRDRAFGIAVFTKPDSDVRLAWVKPFQKVQRDPTANQWDNQTGIPGYKYNSKAAAKTSATYCKSSSRLHACDVCRRT